MIVNTFLFILVIDFKILAKRVTVGKRGFLTVLVTKAALMV